MRVLSAYAVGIGVEVSGLSGLGGRGLRAYL